MDEDQGPSQIVPGAAPRRTMGDRVRGAKSRFFTKDGLVGDYDYAHLFRPNLPFMKKSRRAAPFFGLNDRMPTLLALLLGFQHALAMLAGIVTPPILLSGAAGANLTGEMQQYLVSTALIVSGLLSLIQITRFHILKTPSAPSYYIGTGLISVVGISFSVIPVAQGALAQMYANGFCPTDAQGNKLPCPDGYGAIIGSSALCALIEIAISFMPPKIMLRVFPPIVTGPTVMLIGINLIGTGFQNWMGGSGPCANPTSDFFARCPNIAAPHALPWGSAEYLGLGFSVFITIIICERLGAPIMKSTSVVIGLLVGCIIAAACGPLLAVYIICATEAIGDITATCDVSRLEVEGRLFESRVQGGVLADGINGVLAALMTTTPMTTFAQNNGVIALTRCANRSAGYCCCFFLVVMGIFSKFAASLVAIPSSVLGGMTSFLFTAVAVSGIAIITKGVPFNRRNRFILTAGLTLGYGATLVPNYFDHVFTYAGDNRGLQGFLDAIALIMETGFAITAFVCMALNLLLDEEIEDTEGHDLVPATGAIPSKDVSGGDSARGADSEDIQPVGHNGNGKGEEKLS
ncbi:putative uracil-xanthine permease [Colletotrichum sublineola]|uniref:Putative uracil-xanthine permease n=1 Tax=Colletotrichum sublineola TaxID=1173701 RepID=A0A066WU63_COLSU|nr:putative uracil-xanthine permease [Colletotrichum sublineola]